MFYFKAFSLGYSTRDSLQKLHELTLFVDDLQKFRHDLGILGDKLTSDYASIRERCLCGSLAACIDGLARCARLIRDRPLLAILEYVETVHALLDVITPSFYASEVGTVVRRN